VKDVPSRDDLRPPGSVAALMSADIFKSAQLAHSCPQRERACFKSCNEAPMD
jgi:hypothetical protein